MKLFVGLGNPGGQYATTRHNAGAWWINALAHQEKLTLSDDTSFGATIAKGHTPHGPFLLAIPLTYMNESGRAVQAIKRFYRLEAQDICIIHDELNLSPGTVRLKKGGGHGGHNGLRDIIDTLSGADFYRLRIGIGHPGHKDLVTPYVLSSPSSQDNERIHEAIAYSLRCFNTLIQDDIASVMNTLHQT